jgi:hypothetical protein
MSGTKLVPTDWYIHESSSSGQESRHPSQLAVAPHSRMKTCRPTDAEFRRQGCACYDLMTIGYAMKEVVHAVLASGEQSHDLHCSCLARLASLSDGPREFKWNLCCPQGSRALREVAQLSYVITEISGSSYRSSEVVCLS